jgi:predicted metal-dependent hydrolase
MINADKVQARLEFIKNFYKEAFEQPGRLKAPEIDVRFYPYIGLHHTIRMRGGTAYVRLAELMADAPLAIQRALAFILVSKLMRRKVPKGADQMYRDYTTQEHIRDAAEESRKKRGRKMIGSAQGKIYDLEEMFETINEKYFNGEIEKPVLTWSQKKTYSILGHHDPTHSTIVISKSLDSANVPRFVAEYILYHEILHIKHPIEMINGRQRKHSPAFKKDEKKFDGYAQAERWLKYHI